MFIRSNEIWKVPTHRFQDKRDSFEEFWSQVDGFYSPPKRRRDHSSTSEDIETAYKRLYLEILDSLCNAIETRFKNLKEIRFLELLDPSKQDENKKIS